MIIVNIALIQNSKGISAREVHVFQSLVISPFIMLLWLNVCRKTAEKFGACHQTCHSFCPYRFSPRFNSQETVRIQGSRTVQIISVKQRQNQNSV